MKNFDARFPQAYAGGYSQPKGDSESPAVKLLLTEGEAAQALGISRRTLWTLRNEGKIPYVRIGKCIRYSLAALQEWIQKQNDSSG